MILSWVSAESAQTQDVYFGTSFEDVNRADRDHPLGVLVSQGQTATTYDPEGLLEFGRTYYWRVDEVSAPLDSTISKGDVLELHGRGLCLSDQAKVNATASSSSMPPMGPDKTIDGSGLNANDEHGVSASHDVAQQEEPVPGLDPI